MKRYVCRRQRRISNAVEVFRRREGFWIVLFLAAVLVSVARGAVQAILIGDTLDPKIGINFGGGVRSMRQALELAFPSSGALRIREVTGPQTSPDDILQAIRSVPVEPGDVLLVFWTPRPCLALHDWERLGRIRAIQSCNVIGVPHEPRLHLQPIRKRSESVRDGLSLLPSRLASHARDPSPVEAPTRNSPAFPARARGATQCPA